MLVPVPGVYALGDCCANMDTPLPPLAQVAEQQGKYLAAVLNEEAANLNPWQGLGSGHAAAVAAAAAGGSSSSSPSAAGGANAKPPLQPFKYRHLGSMATVGACAVLNVPGSCILPSV
jgi:NADH:ubiquinone reductase (non-electrogenic)